MESSLWLHVVFQILANLRCQNMTHFIAIGFFFNERVQLHAVRKKKTTKLRTLHNFTKCHLIYVSDTHVIHTCNSLNSHNYKVPGAIQM